MSDHRSVSVQDRRVAPAEPGYRSSRRASSPPPPPDDLPPRGRRSGGGPGGGKLRVLAYISIALTVILVGGSLTAYAIYRDALGDIVTAPPAEIIGPRPQNLTGALNILIVGSDTRAGEGNAKYGQEAARDTAFGKRTDTIILLHISPNRDKAQLISFPRDSMVQIPECRSEQTKQVIASHMEMINSAYNSGGIGCTIDTIETLTGIRVDHHVEVDFAGFKNIVNSLGGIEMCFSKPIDDKKSKFHVEAGTHTLNGEQALGFMRLRSVGDGSDLSRIKRQQKLLSKLVQTATSTDLLTDAPKLLSLIKSAAKSVTMDKALAEDSQKLIDIAGSAKALTASEVKFIMIPVTAYVADANRVQWREPDAGNLFKQIAQDIEVVQPTPTASAKPVVKPAQVRVQVLNGSGKFGEAQRVADELTKHGFTVVGVGNAAGPAGAKVATTKVLYSQKAPTDADYASVAAAKLSGTVTASAKKVKPTEVHDYTATAGVVAPDGTEPATKGPIVQVVIGEDFKGVRVPSTVSQAVKDNTVSADAKNLCT